MAQSLARLKLLKGSNLLKITADTWDDELKFALNKASETANGQTDRTLEHTTYTDEYYTPIDYRKLWLREYPVTEVTAVKFWDTVTDAYVTETATYYTLIDQSYIYYPAKGQTATYTTLPKNEELSMQVSFKAGYVTTGWETMSLGNDFGVPADLEWAVAAVAAIDWSLGREDKSMLGIIARQVGAETVTLEQLEPGMYPAKIMKTFARYRRLPTL